MNWIKQNKFLTGFIVFMGVSLVALGYLLFAAKGKYEEVQGDYATKTAELNRLETLNPYPEAANLKQFDAQKKDHADAIVALQKNLAVTEIPIEPLTPEQFQDTLRETVTRITNLATTKGVKLSDGQKAFYLGFDKYQTQPPLPDAAPVLGRQLKAIELVISQMLETGIVALTELKRDALPEEEGKGKKQAGNAAGKGGAVAPKDLVSKHGFQIEFTADQSRFRTILNSIVANKTQFFIPRLVMVKNQRETAPQKAVPVAGAAPAIDPKTGQPIPLPPNGAPLELEGKKLVFGAEKVDVSLLLEMIDFAEVATK